MTREDLAKDILIAFIPQWPEIATNLLPTDNPVAELAKHSVELADALLDALASKEAPASWLSREMRTPAKGFPAITNALTVGDTVALPPDLRECCGLQLRGILISFPAFGVAEVLLQIGDSKQYIEIPTYRLAKVPE